MNRLLILARCLPWSSVLVQSARGLLRIALCGLFSATSVNAQPIGPNVIAGAATVISVPGMTTVTAGNNSVLQWNSFNVALSHTVQFVQPSSESRVLNWIGGATASQIDGVIRANGQVYLVNPAGVYFGRTAIVDAARLYAVAGSLSKEDFFAGNDRFTHLMGDVRNEGSLHASIVALIGRTVANSGTIVSPDGLVALAAGEQVFLGRKGSSIYVDTGANGSIDTPKITSSAGVINSGTVDAGRGSVALAAGDLYSIAISQAGKLIGNDVRVQGKGRGDVVISGEIDASSGEKGKRGGYVEVTGERVALSQNASIDVSGLAGGGTLLVGGDAHGGNPGVRNSLDTSIAKGAVLKANAKEQGDGGKIVVWSSGSTFYKGSLFARGAGLSGGGGFAEVSGAQLSFEGSADLLSPFGPVGNLLLDPFNLTINNAADLNVGSGDEAFPRIAYSSRASPSTLSWTTILAALGSANVFIHTSAGSTSELGDITIAASPGSGLYNTPFNLEIVSDLAGGIFVNAPVLNGGVGNISLSAGTRGITFGGISGSTILQTGGIVSLGSSGNISGFGVIRAGNQLQLSSAATARLTTDTSVIKLTGSVDTFIQNTHTGGLIVNVTPASGGALNVESRNAIGSDDKLTIQPDPASPGSVNFGSLRLWGSDLALSDGSIIGSNLTLGNSGTVTLPSGWSDHVLTLTLENSGDLGSFSTLAPNIIFNKTGGNVDMKDGLPTPVTVSGVSTNTAIRLQVDGGSGTVNIGTPSWTATRIDIDGGVSGSGTLAATVRLGLGGQISAGSAGSPLSIKTPLLGIGKSGLNDVYVSNALDAGLSVDGYASMLSVTSQNTLRTGLAPLVVEVNGLDGGRSLDISASTISLGGKLVSPTISINNSGAFTLRDGRFTGSGNPVRVTSSGMLNLTGAGDVGTATIPIWTDIPIVNINKPAGGAVFVDNGTTALGTNFTAFNGGGAFSGSDLSILSRGAVNVGANPLSFTSSGNLNLANVSISAGTLGLAHDGALSNFISPVTSTLILGGAGDDGSSTRHFSTSVLNLLLQKTAGATVYIDNGSTSGLTLSGASNARINVSSLDGAFLGANILTIGPTGLSNAGSTTLTSSTLALGSGITSPLITLNTSALAIGAGKLAASTQLVLNGTGNIGTTLSPVAISTPSLVLNKPTGAVYVDNGSVAFSLTPTIFTASGSFAGGKISILGPMDVGANNLTFTSSGVLDLGFFVLRANTLSLAHDGALANYTNPLVNTLVLGGAGDDGAAASTFVFSATNLILTKTGVANVFVENRLNGGLNVSGSTTSSASIVSSNLAGTSRAGLILGPAGLTVGRTVTLNSSSLSLLGSLFSPSVILANSDTMSGVGAIRASIQLTLNGAGDVGSSAASISITTPTVTINKSAGVVFLNNGTSDLTVTPVSVSAAAGFVGGNLSLLAPLSVGGNSLSFTSSGMLNLGANAVSGGNVSVNHGGAFSSTGTITATQLNLLGAGSVGTAAAPVLTRTPSVLANKTAGAVFVDNGVLDLAFTPTSFVAGGALRAANLTLLGAVNTPGSNVNFTATGNLDLKGNAISADILTLAQNGSLSNFGNLSVNTLVFGGSGDVGTAATHLAISIPSLLLNKTGTGSVYVDNKRDLGLTLAGSAGALVSVSSFNQAGTSLASLTIGSVGLGTPGIASSTSTSGAIGAADLLPARGSSTPAASSGNEIVLTASAVSLNGTIDAATLTVNNSGSLTGPGQLGASSQLNLGSTGDVGSSAAPITVNTPVLAVNKTAGVVYIVNNGGALTFTPTIFAGGGSIGSGSFTLHGPLDLGSNNLAITTTGGLSLGSFSIKAGAVTFNNGGALSGTGTVTASNLTLGSAGQVGSAGSPLTFSGAPGAVSYNRLPSGVYLAYNGGRGIDPSIGISASIADQSHQLSVFQNQDDALSSESEAAATPGHSSRRGGAAFRAISAKADLFSAARDQLQALGIYARPLNPEERLLRERKEGVFVSVPEKERPRESDFEVVDARIDPTALREVLRLATETGLTEPGKARLEQVAHALSATFTAFSATSPGAEAASFRSWLEKRGDSDATTVLNFIKSMRSTLREIELLGLTNQEIDVSKSQIFGIILRQRLNADPDFLRALVELPSPSNTALLELPSRRDAFAYVK